MQLADGSHVMVSVVGEDGEGNVVVSFDGGETQVSMRREDVQGMVDLARAQRWELLLDNDEQEKAKATGEDVSPVEGEGVPSATTEGAESRGFELNDVVEVRGENGQMVQGYVTRPMNEDGLYEVFTDSDVGGLRSAYYAPEDMRLVEAKGVEGMRESAQEGEDGTLQGEEVQPSGRGVMGNIYDLFRGKAKEAVDFLMRKKEGVAVGALHHREVGDIDLWWGNEKAGLMKIARKHPEVLDNLQGVLDGMRVVQASDNRVILESDTHKAVVSNNWLGEKIGSQWLLTAYEKKGTDTSGGSIDIVPEPNGKQNGTAPLQDVVPSEGKDSVSSGNGQGNVGENVTEMPMRRVKRKIEGQVMEVDEEDFEAVSPERTADYLYNEEQSGISREQADDFVEAKIAENEKVVKGIEARKPRKGASPAEIRVHKGKVEAELAEAVPHLEYWRSVAAARDAVKEREIAAANERYRQERAAKEEAKRAAEVQRKEENGVGAAVRERWLNAPKVEGNADELTLANGEHVGGRYVLVESGAVSASHQATNGFARTEGFPMDENGGTVNDRDYERDGDAQRVTREIAQDYDARALQSPVVVSGDGVVLSGNGRTMAGELAALEGTDEAYVEHLKRYGAKYGFTREQVERMQHPRVVFVLDEALPYTAETFAKFNARETKAQSKTEEAVKLGKVVDDGTFGRVLRVLGGFETLGEFYGDEGAVREVVGELANAGVVGRMDMGGLFDGEGVSVQGRELIENVLVGKAFEGDGDAVRRLTEMKSMRTSVVNALGEVLRNKSLGGAFDFMEELPKAVALVYEARKTGGYKVGDAVDGFALQYDMFGEGQTVADPTDVAVLLLANAINDKRNTRLKGVLASYNDLAEDAAMGQGDIFSGFAQNKQSILEDVMRILQLSTPLTTNEHELSQLRDGEREQETQETDARAAETGVGETGASDEGLEDERGGIGEASLSAKIAAAEGKVNTNPSDAQKEAGNYKKGHVQVGAFDISIEQPKGSVRRGVDANGKAWESKMHNTYGYFRGTEGVDGDHIDVFVSNDIDGWNGQKVFVVDQYNPDGTFDEHKVMLGFNDAEDAMSDYLANYEKGWEDGRRLDVSATSLEDFEKWLASSHRKTKPFAEYKGVEREVDEVDAALKKELQDFIAQTDTMGRTAMDESVYDAEELFAPLLLDGKPSPLAVMTSVSDDINDPSVQIAVYDYSQEIDEKTNSGWQKWSNLADEYNAQAAEEDKGWERGDTATLGFRSVDAAVRFYDWVQHRDGGKLHRKGATDAALHAVDNQGNLVDGEGRLVTEKVGSIDELRDEDFTSPSRSVELPELDARVADAIGTGGKPVVIKKNIFERNAKAHGDLTAADSRDILKAALYTPTLYGQNQKTKRPYNWVLIKTRDAEGENRVVLLEVNENKDNVEIVHWHYVRDNALETIKRQAVREGGPILILPSEESEEAGGLSSRTNNLSSEGKVSESSKKEQGFDGKNGVIRLQKGDDGVAARDAAYADAVARGDMETAERMLAEEAARKGYMVESDYQGTSAFNGAAPSENGYYESLEERKAAFDEEDFEGDWSLADELVHGIEMGSLDFRLSDGELYRADRSRREAIQNLRNVRARVNAGEKDVRITMYRSVPAGVVEGEFRNGDWVTPSRLYAEGNAAVHGDYPGWENGYRIIEQEVPIEDVWWDGNDIAEWGYDNGREQVYKNVPNNRKSFSVTYDADGVLIPLSKRFDEGVSDVSYHKGDDVVVSAEDAALRDAVVELMRGAGIDVVVDSEEGQRVLDMENGGVRLEEDMEGVNARFNDELSGLTEANADKVVLSLGRPSGILLSAGVGNKVMKKMRKHGFALEELRDLPRAVADPVAVFNNYGEVGNRSILTELRTKQGNFLVSVDIGKDADIDFNIVRSVFGKGDNSIMDWINKGLATYINKKKALTFLSHQSAPIAATAANAELSSAAKVVKDFENPKLRVEKRRFFRTEDGKAYGFTVDGKVYLDPRMAGVETAVHEYTHLWADALRRVNPEEWRNVVELMKGTSVWDEVKRNYPELESEDEIADEVLAHYSGRRGAERLRAALDEEMGKADGVFERAQVVSAFERVKRALARFWKGVADFMGVHFGSAEEVADMVLGDLLRGRKLDGENVSVSMVGRSLTAEEAKELVSMMEENAAPVRELALTRENWAAEFGADGVVQTPLGEVKMGEHQYEKLEQQGRRGKLGMVKPTLESPDVVIEDKSRAKGGEETERGSSYVFVRSFVNEEGKRQYFFTSVTVHRNNQEVVISNQEKTGKRISNLLQQGEIGWINEKYQPASETQGEEISLSQDNSWTDTSGDKNAVPLGVNLSETSAAKVDKSSENGKGEDIFSMAERIAEETKRGQRARRNARYHREGGSVEYGQAVSRAAYEQRMASGAFQSREALQDSMLSLREAMDLILHEGKHGKGWRVEDVSDLENAYMGENRLSSVNSAEQEAFTRGMFKPMLGAVAKLAETEEERMVLTDYLMAKHGLERNRVMAEREGLKAYETYMKKHPESEREMEEFIAKARERDYAGLTELTGVEEVSGAEMEAAKMVEEFEEKG